MTDQSAKPFEFDLAETLFFHRNEGVSEMLGIGLDPEISIESHPDHVSIRGIIALTGEYLPVFVEDRSDVDDQDEIQARYFKRVERDEDGVCEFLHHFPIDISIPHERVKNLADLTVNIDHFDYHVPHARRLELEATVQINGLGYQQISEDNTEDTLTDEELVTETEDEERIYFDLKVKDEDEPKPSEPEEEIDSVALDLEEDKVVQLKQKEQPEINEEEEDVSEEIEVNIEQGKSRDDDLGDEEEKERVQEPTYLLDLFDQEVEEENRYSQLKMYIVQDDDSLEGIADKYQVSVAKLQRANQIETTSVHQGQIIYVPK